MSNPLVAWRENGKTRSIATKEVILQSRSFAGPTVGAFVSFKFENVGNHFAYFVSRSNMTHDLRIFYMLLVFSIQLFLHNGMKLVQTVSYHYLTNYAEFGRSLM